LPGPFSGVVGGTHISSIARRVGAAQTV